MRASARPARVTPRRILLETLAAAAALAAVALLAAHLGASSVGLEALAGEEGSGARRILLAVRLPRVAAAAVLGGALAVAGVAFQALLRNPLADPYVLGVSGGASLGGVVALLAGGAAVAGFAVPAAAFAGALAALAAIERLATVGGRLSVTTLLLTGAVFNAFAAALLFFLQSVASAEELHAIVFYLMGRVPAPGTGELALFAAATGAAALALYASARDFDALGFGEEGARQLGVDVERLKRRTFVLGSLLTALAVSLAGLIGFVGLIVPHLLRLVVGPGHRRLLPLALFGGGAFLVLADLVARTLLAPSELPVGVVTALAGGPFFLVLLRHRTRVKRD